MAYLKSNSPLFSIVKEADFREWTTIDPKLISLMGEIKKREKTALALILIGMFAMTSPFSPVCVSITWTAVEEGNRLGIYRYVKTFIVDTSYKSTSSLIRTLSLYMDMCIIIIVPSTCM